MLVRSCDVVRSGKMAVKREVVYVNVMHTLPSLLLPNIYHMQWQVRECHASQQPRYSSVSGGVH